MYRPGQFSMTLLNRKGDVTITWTDDKDEEVLKFISDKMKQGYTFFILDPNGPKREVSDSLADARALLTAREISIDDEAAEKMVKDGRFKLFREDGSYGDIVSIGIAETPEKVAESQTVATRPVRGG